MLEPPKIQLLDFLYGEWGENADQLLRYWTRIAQQNQRFVAWETEVAL